ncbi:MAG: HYC_CC_PP family protein [Mangrovibacterium sp.]
MKHSIFHKVMSLVMMIVVLFATMSFTVGMHYCGDNLMKTSVFSSVTGCGMEMETTPISDCLTHSPGVKDRCCVNKNLVIDGLSELSQSVDKTTFKHVTFVAYYIYAYVSIFENSKATKYVDKYFHPPIITRDIHKLDETYII